MANETALKVIKNDDGYELICSVKHPMESSGRNPRYIESMTFSLNNEVVAEITLGPNVSLNPIIGTQVNAAAGDSVSVQWRDTHSNHGSARLVIDV